MRGGGFEGVEMKHTYDMKIQKIIRLFNERVAGTKQSVAHSYIACLNNEEIAKAILETLEVSGELYPVLLRAASRRSESCIVPEYKAVSKALMRNWETAGRRRARIDSALAAIYPGIQAPDRQIVLDFWYSRQTKGSLSRWFKALSNDTFLFSWDAIFDYWFETNDMSAAKLIAYEAPEHRLEEILWDLVKTETEGWIIPRAIIRTKPKDQDLWNLLEETYPATFAYVSVKLNKRLTQEDCKKAILSESGTTNQRGLAIWAAGQMGYWSVLEDIEEMADKLDEYDMNYFS